VSLYLNRESRAGGPGDSVLAVRGLLAAGQVGGRGRGAPRRRRTGLCWPRPRLPPACGLLACGRAGDGGRRAQAVRVRPGAVREMHPDPGARGGRGEPKRASLRF
jgi:hypothetical protein